MDGYRSPRMRYGQAPLDQIDNLPLPESIEEILNAHLVRQALRQLPEVHRRALEAVYLHDQTTAQAACQLNVPLGTMKSRVFYGLRMLRSIMDVDAPRSEVA
jgi:RNA polymerase sigma-70 factor (ECF subfamily)